ncbi:PAS domain-containing sensor histidine kinase [Fulvimonas yonginensis]|uniref:histidine kinase n=1 Tax=Fulvimonas yonginensis TaxID=1495200 RepID=A0ABU8J828_9GAMM
MAGYYAACASRADQSASRADRRRSHARQAALPRPAGGRRTSEGFHACLSASARARRLACRPSGGVSTPRGRPAFRRNAARTFPWPQLPGDVSKMTSASARSGPVERLLQEMIDLMPVGVWVADRTGRLVRMNRAARRIWRTEAHPDELASLRAWRVDSGGELAPGDWGLQRAIRERKTSEQLLRARCPDGSERTILNTAAPLNDAQGRLTGAVAVDEDVTELIAARALSEKRGQLLQTVLDLLPVGVLRFDPTGQIVEANPAARRLWGLEDQGPLPDLADFRARDVATGERIVPGGWASTLALHRGETIRDELLEICGFNGSSRTIFNSAAPLYLHEPRPVGAVAVNQDVSSLYRTQQQLRTAVRDREQLLAFVAHDLRNPLAGLMLLAGSIERAAQGGMDPADIRALTGKLQERVQGLAGLVDDLLAISAGGLADVSMLNLQQARPEQLVSDATEQVQDLFDARGIDLVVQVAHGLPAVMVDRQRLQRVWSNLLDNALKHTEPGGRVTLGATGHAAVAFCVSNSGPALSAGQMGAMFRPFWQARRDKQGAGLGLSIARAIVEAHGGSIWAEAAEGERVCVKFELPRIELTRSPPSRRSRHAA